MSRYTVTRISDHEPTGDEARKIVGGWVTMLTLKDGSQMLIDEEGDLKGLTLNPEASRLAGQPIVGNALILEGASRWT